MPRRLPVCRRERLVETVENGLAALESRQHADGHFCGELEGDSILESEYILMKFILGQERAPMASGADGWDTLGEIARYLRSLQRDDGGWGQYPGSGVDLSASVKAYLALKLMGDPPHAEHMRLAKEVIRAKGGAEGCNSFTNLHLACLGQISWNAMPAIPPEIVLLPAWSYFHLTKVSAWTRTMILPLSLVVTRRPRRRLPAALGIDELFVDERLRHRLTPGNPAPRAWAAVFAAIDRGLKLVHAIGGSPVRRLALARAEEWILARASQGGIAETEGLGAIFPAMVYLQIALHAQDYPRAHPLRQRAERDLDAFFITDDRGIRIQPCLSPVWDTGIALYAMTDCGRGAGDDAAERAADWLRRKECRHVGDWAANLTPPVTAGGWYFEYRNAWYPDVDDTAMVAMALARTGGTANRAAAARGVAWILAMQNDDGGWAAFDKTRHRQVLEYVPFADHNAMQDPSCPDITGRVLECLAWHGFRAGDPPVARALTYLESKQEPEGCFFGRWGVNYIYGTWQSVVGPIRCGVDPGAPWIRAAGAWIKSVQQTDGSFGESADSYEHPSLKGRGPSTASQTAWAAMILQEVFGPHDPDLARAIDWLAQAQLTRAEAADPVANPDGDPPGSWAETEFTGTGFPRVFYLRYHLYRLYFPVMAIGRYLTAHGVKTGEPRVIKMQPKLVAV